MKRWTDIVLVLCMAGVAFAQWVAPSTMDGLLDVLLLTLVILTILSQRHATRRNLGSLNAAHEEQLDSERRYRALFDACSDAIVVYRLESDGRPGQVVEVNEAACAFLGYARAQLMTMSAPELYVPKAWQDGLERSRVFSAAGSLVLETACITRQGEVMPVEVSARLVQIGGRTLCLTASRSIAAHKELEVHLRELSDVDELTGLLNRRGFFASIDEVQRRAKLMQSQVLFVYLDVDGLKRVNDEMGHAAGDKLILAAADVLRTAFRSEDVVARLGGDEFAALAVLGRSQDEHLHRQAIESRLQDAVRARRAKLGADYDFSLSFGGMVANSVELEQIDELLARADQRMYEAKRAGRL